MNFRKKELKCSDSFKRKLRIKIRDNLLLFTFFNLSLIFGFNFLSFFSQKSFLDDVVSFQHKNILKRKVNTINSFKNQFIRSQLLLPVDFRLFDPLFLFPLGFVTCYWRGSLNYIAAILIELL